MYHVETTKTTLVYYDTIEFYFMQRKNLLLLQTIVHPSLDWHDSSIFLNQAYQPNDA